LRISLIYSVLRKSVSQKEHFLLSSNSVSEQFRAAINCIRAVICIESKWVGSHIKLGYDLKQNVMEVRTQFDMAVNPL